MNQRFIEFMTQKTDDGELICGFKDITNDKWYYTKDRENAKGICELLNDLTQKNMELEITCKPLFSKRQLHEKNQQLQARLHDKDDLLQKQITVSQNLDKQLRQREKELADIKRTLNDMIDNERTHLGANALIQFREAIQ